jgi:uncharacterized protein GlcG (DUF336 family)
MAQSAGTTNYLGSSPSQRHVISQTQALTIINGSAAESAAINIPVNIAVTDPSGTLVAFLRTDNAFPASIDIAMKKARTVSLFNGAFTTANLYELTQPGKSLYAIQEIVDGYFVGAIGVSGGTTDEDVQIATAGLKALEGKGS